MKKIFLACLMAGGLSACNHQPDHPDVSAINVKLEVVRFDQAFFTSDTSDIGALQANYPWLLPLYLQNIVGVNDAAGAAAFYRSYKPVYDSSQLQYADFGPVVKEVQEAFRHIKYYFPNYQLPVKLVPVIGPMNSREDLAKMANGELTPDFLGPDFAGISLQFYLGAGFSLYQHQYFINNVAPLYRSRRFSKEYIAADLLKLVTDDLFPDKSSTRPLIEQMIEKGKRWWLLSRFMPDTPDSIRTGYTKAQLDWCERNEGNLWAYILKNENLYSLEPATIQTYIGEAPFTQGFEESPGNIGPWFGRQIVARFAEANPALSPQQVMEAAPKDILEQAKYKPK